MQVWVKTELVTLRGLAPRTLVQQRDHLQRNGEATDRPHTFRQAAGVVSPESTGIR